jgi:hypothetical protein
MKFSFSAVDRLDSDVGLLQGASTLASLDPENVPYTLHLVFVVMGRLIIRTQPICWPSHGLGIWHSSSNH